MPDAQQRHIRASLPVIGPICALASALLFGASTPFAKYLLGQIDPWMLAGLLYCASGLGLAVFRLSTAAWGRRSAETRLGLADMPVLAAVTLAGGVAGPLLLMLGLQTTPASSAALLLNLESLATMAIAWTVFYEQTDRRVLAGALAIFAGAVVLSWPSGAGGFGWGALAVAGACLAWGIDNNLTRHLSASDPVEIAMIKGLAAGPVTLAAAFWHGGGAAPWPEAATLAGAMAVGFLGYGVSLVLFVLALRHLGTARSGAYFSFAPFIGALLAVALFGDPLTWRLAGAALLMGLGLYLHLAERHEHDHDHLDLAHDHLHIHDAHHRHEHQTDEPIAEPHAHRHHHLAMRHRHPHYPDLHHRHNHGD